MNLAVVNMTLKTNSGFVAAAFVAVGSLSLMGQSQLSRRIWFVIT